MVDQWTTDERQWVTRKWALIRQSQQIADRANNNYRRLSDEINDYLDRSGITDIVHRARIKSDSLPLKDALEEGKWHSANAQRHIDDLALFIRLREAGLL